jgi:hypothetical protein
MLSMFTSLKMPVGPKIGAIYAQARWSFQELPLQGLIKSDMWMWIYLCVITYVLCWILYDMLYIQYLIYIYVCIFIYIYICMYIYICLCYKLLTIITCYNYIKDVYSHTMKNDEMPNWWKSIIFHQVQWMPMPWSCPGPADVGPFCRGEANDYARSWVWAIMLKDRCPGPSRPED